MLKTFLVLEPILHDNKYYKPNSTIRLDEEQAGELRQLGAIGSEIGTVTAASPAAAVVNATPLPEDFPGRDVLLPAGYDSIEVIQATSPERLQTVKGVGPALIAKIDAWFANQADV